MKLEDQVVSLELAKKLKELGVKQESLFWYEKLDLKNWEIEQGVQEYALGLVEDEPVKTTDIPAYTVAELGEMLPNEREDKYAFFSGLAINGWYCEVKNYKVMPYERLHVELQCDTEADARAKTLIYLLENNLIELT